MQQLEYVTVSIGAALPAISFLLQHYFSTKADTQDAFRSHKVVYWGDWLLVPFTATAGLLVSWINVAWLLAPCLAVSYITHRVWANNADETARHFFSPGFDRLSAAGWVHHGFTTTVLSVIVAFLLSSSNDEVLVFTATSSLVAYAVGMIVFSYLMHRTFKIMDVAIASALLLACAVKLLYY